MSPNRDYYDYFYAYSNDYYDEDDEDSATVRFCGDPLWVRDTLGPWRLPLFSWCFQHAILAQIPVLFFFVSLPFLWLRYRIVGGIGAALPYDWLASMKYALTVILAADKFALLMRSFYQWIFEAENVPLIELLYPMLNFVTLYCMIVVINRCRHYGIVAPGQLFCTWLLFVVCGFPEFYVWILVGTNPLTVNDVDFLRYLAYLIWFPICVLQCILHLFADHVHRDAKTTAAELHASFLSRQLLAWFTDVLERVKCDGAPVACLDDDALTLPAAMSSQTLFEKWNQEWGLRIRKTQIANCAKPVMHHISHHDDGVQVGYDDATPLKFPPINYYGAINDVETNAGKKSESNATPRVDRSIVWTVLKLHKWHIIYSAFFRLVADLTQFIPPILLIKLLRFVERGNDAPRWHGCGIALAMFTGAQISSLAHNAYAVNADHMRVSVHSMLTSAVYDKALRLFSDAYFVTNRKELFGVISRDIQNLEMVVVLVIQFVSLILQALIGVFLLWQIVGWAALAASAFFLLLTMCDVMLRNVTKYSKLELSLINGDDASDNAPLNKRAASTPASATNGALVAVRPPNARTLALAAKRQRLEITRELVNFPQDVEELQAKAALLERLSACHRREMPALKRAKAFKDLLALLKLSANFIASFFTFFLYSTISAMEMSLFSPTIIFVSLFLIVLLQRPSSQAAKFYVKYFAAQLSNTRLSKFFKEEELDVTQVERDLCPDYERAVDIQLASFDASGASASGTCTVDSYQHTSRMVHLPYALCDVEVHVKRGILVVIVAARVDESCVKSSTGAVQLLRSIMGETRKAYGYVGVRGRVAYCPRSAWILNKTIRANVLMSLAENDVDVDEKQYKRVIDACELNASDVLPDGDRTLIADDDAYNALTDADMRVQVTLARAGYAHADVYLVEDVLAAMNDDALAARLFERVIAGTEPLFAQATRIIISNQRAHAQRADLVLVVQGNRIKLSGTYEELTQDEQTAKLLNDAFEAAKNDEIRLVDDSTSENVTNNALSSFLLSAELQVAAGAHDDVREERALSNYLRQSRHHTFVVGIIFTLGGAFFAAMNQYWLSDWADPQNNIETSERFTVYFVLGIFMVLLLAAALFTTLCGTVHAGLSIFDSMAAVLGQNSLNVPERGILKQLFYRAFKDVESIDWRVGLKYQEFILAGGNVLYIVGVFAARRPIFILPTIIALFVTGRVTYSFLGAATRLHNANTVSFNALLIRINDTVRGLRTIRAFGVVWKFTQKFSKMVDHHNSSKLATLLALRWLIIRIELIGNLFLFSIVLAAAFSANFSLTPNFVGLFVFTAFQLTSALVEFARAYAYFGIESASLARMDSGSIEELIRPEAQVAVQFPETEIHEAEKADRAKAMRSRLEMIQELDELVATEESSTKNLEEIERLENLIRELEVRRVKSETLESVEPDLMIWPAYGRLEFRRFSCRTRDNAAWAIDAFSARINAGERVGVMKCRATNTLWAAILCDLPCELERGELLIDDARLANIDAREVRARIGFISARLPLFAGTLRFNLDASNMYADEDAPLLCALNVAKLGDFLEGFGGLDAEIYDNHPLITNEIRVSIALARAILHKRALLLLDDTRFVSGSRFDRWARNLLYEQFCDATIIHFTQRARNLELCNREIIVTARNKLKLR